MTSWQEKEKIRRQRLAEWRQATAHLLEAFNTAAVPSNTRPGSKIEAYNLPPEMNEELCRLRKAHGHSENNPIYPHVCDNWTVGTYGKANNKFYIYRFTKKQSAEIIGALETAAEEATGPAAL